MDFEDIKINTDEEKYDFVFRFMPWFVCNLKPDRKLLLDDTCYLEISCPNELDFHFNKLTIDNITCRVLTFDNPVFAGMEVPMCMTVTTKGDAELLGYFTLEKNDYMGYVTCKVDIEKHTLLNHIKWDERPSVESFATEVTKTLRRDEKI